MDETPDEVQGIPAAEAPDVAQRNLTTTVVETYLGLKVLDTVLDDVVSDAYDGAKAAGKAALGKLRGRPDAPAPGEGGDPAPGAEPGPES